MNIQRQAKGSQQPLPLPLLCLSAIPTGTADRFVSFYFKIRFSIRFRFHLRILSMPPP